jgi:type II secretory pathway predicted ATPase ExeA
LSQIDGETGVREGRDEFLSTPADSGRSFLRMSAFRLEKEPFPVNGGAEFYFSTPALEARCDELCCAIEAGHVLLVDVEASGKTTMLDSFVEAADDRWRIFRLDAHARMGAKDFVDALVSCFGLPAREPPAARFRDADALFELLTAQSRMAVIVIDDVHRLERSALEQLVYLARRWQKFSVRFLICAETMLMAELESLQEGACLPGNVRSFDMPRFNPEQVGDYLHMCLFRAGLVGDSPFDPGVVAMVTEKAYGLVGAIDPIARELVDSAATGGRPGNDVKLASRRWPVAVIAAAGLGMLLSVAMPGPSASRAKAQSRPHLDGFQSSISVAPRGRAGFIQERSASVDAAAP